ncbi:hypothetical protein MRX96_032374 [Rhipicephalus microplus]
MRVYKPFLACCFRYGRQCPLVTPTDPGHRDHSATVIVVTRVSLPGRLSPRSCHLEESLPGQACPPLATGRVHLVAHPGFRSPLVHPAPPFKVGHTGATPGPVASSWHYGVYWRFCGSVGSFSRSTTRRSPGHHDSVPAGARDAALPLSWLRRAAKPALQFCSDCPQGGATWNENTGFCQRGISTCASPVMPG